jgi:hypothetical protein
MRANLPVSKYAVLLSLIILLVTNAAAIQGKNKSEPAQPEYESGVNADKEPPVSLIPIEKVGDAIHGDDTVKIGQVIAITLKTDRDMKFFDVLFINGFRVNIARKDTSDIGKIVFYEIGNQALDVVEQFMERSSRSRSVVPITVSLGSNDPKTKNPLTTSQIVYLEVKPKISNIYVFVIIALGTLCMIALALYKNVLKDDNNLYYSLGRSQLFFWTVLFVAGYIYIWYRTDVLPDLTESMLVILGISIGTTAMGKVVENSTKGKAPIDAAAKSEGWFIDILSDSSSINIQRFQSVLFNFVFGGIFLQRCISNHVLPEFDPNILLLMGISSSAYAGLKITEPVKEQKQPSPVTGDDVDADIKEGEGKGAASPVSVG